MASKPSAGSTVTRRYWGTLYYVRPDWHGDPDHVDESVVETYRHGPSDIEVAMELWRLTGNDGAAQEITGILEESSSDDGLVMDDAHIANLLNNLERLEPELEKTIVGSDWRVPEEKLAALRARARLVDLDQSRGVLANDGVLEAMHRVVALRNILRDALQRGLHVALD